MAMTPVFHSFFAHRVPPNHRGWESRQRISFVESDRTVDVIVRHVAGDLGLTSWETHMAIIGVDL
jgi:hypothetical protein